MKATQRCPKCSGTRLYVCVNRQPGQEHQNVIFDLVVTTVPLAPGDLGATHGTPNRTHVGTYETWICAGCAYTEWYAQDPEHLLQKLSTMPGSGIRGVDSSPATPFR